MEDTVNKNTAILLQLSALTQYFIPLGNYIIPTVIWSTQKERSKFVDYNGRQLINFQLSLLLYYLILGVTSITLLLYGVFSDLKFKTPFFHDSGWIIEEFSTAKVTGLAIIGIVAVSLIVLLKIFEFFLIIYAAVKNSNGENYKYPLTFNFIK